MEGSICANGDGLGVQKGNIKPYRAALSISAGFVLSPLSPLREIRIRATYLEVQEVFSPSAIARTSSGALAAASRHTMLEDLAPRYGDRESQRC